jgi:chemotaxis protein MotA
MIIEGIMSIQAGDNPRTLEAKLLSFLPPSQRKSQFE